MITFSNGFTDGWLTWKSTQQKDHEEETQNRKRPNDANDPPGGSRSRRRTVQLVTPKPQRGNPDLLRTLNDTRAKDPYFRSGSSFLAKIETEEGETTGGSCAIGGGRDGSKYIARREQARVYKGKSNKKEGDTEEEPRN